jgi:c-di-AMP phosphodiesterase-like protein
VKKSELIVLLSLSSTNNILNNWSSKSFFFRKRFFSGRKNFNMRILKKKLDALKRQKFEVLSLLRKI